MEPDWPTCTVAVEEAEKKRVEEAEKKRDRADCTGVQLWHEGPCLAHVLALVIRVVK